MIGNHVAAMVILGMMADHDAKHGKKWKMYDPTLVRAWFAIVDETDKVPFSIIDNKRKTNKKGRANV